MTSRTVFMISDGTGLTVESFTKSLLTQFAHITFDVRMQPYIDSTEKADAIVLEINQQYAQTGITPLVFMTLINPEISQLIHQAKGCFFDLFHPVLTSLEKELGTKSSDTIGLAHGLANRQAYDQRIAAINYALTYDDGVKPAGYHDADIILIGVSRCGKTPSCLYMALIFGIFAANYPLIDDDLTPRKLPDILKPHQHKLFGLTIDPKRLHGIRNERRPDSQYASLSQCRYEVMQVERLYQQEHIPYLNSTRYSIEEIATKIMSLCQLTRKI